MFSVGPVHRTGWRDGGQDRRDSFHALRETHVEIPFVMNLKRFDATCNRMVRQARKISRPCRIDRPIDFIGTAQPLQELILAFFFGHFDGPVDRAKSHASVHEARKLPDVIVR